MKAASATRLCLVGATGLIGSRLIARAVGRTGIRVVGVARREAKLPPGARMEMLVAEPEHWPDAIAASNASVLICALGTTWKKSGENEAAFRAVDHDLVLDAAHAAKAAGIGHMIVVSSVGADPRSRNRYLRTKGEMEEALARVGLKRLDILRPSLLRGPRGEIRPLERLGMLFAPLMDLFLHGRYRQYRSLRADTVVEAIFALAQEKAAGRFVHDHDAMLRAVRRAGEKSRARVGRG